MTLRVAIVGMFAQQTAVANLVEGQSLNSAVTRLCLHMVLYDCLAVYDHESCQVIHRLGPK